MKQCNKYTLFDGLAYNMLNHRIRGLLFHYKKIVILQLASIFLVRVFKNTLIPSVKMTLTMNKMFAGIICQTVEREVDYSTAKKIAILASILRCEYPKHPDSVCANDVNNTKAS